MEAALFASQQHNGSLKAARRYRGWRESGIARRVCSSSGGKRHLVRRVATRTARRRCDAASRITTVAEDEHRQHQAAAVHATHLSCARTHARTLARMLALVTMVGINASSRQKKAPPVPHTHAFCVGYLFAVKRISHVEQTNGRGRGAHSAR